MCQVHKLKIQGHLCMKKSQSTFFTPPPTKKRKTFALDSHILSFTGVKILPN